MPWLLHGAPFVASIKHQIHQVNIKREVSNIEHKGIWPTNGDANIDSHGRIDNDNYNHTENHNDINIVISVTISTKKTTAITLATKTKITTTITLTTTTKSDNDQDIASEHNDNVIDDDYDKPISR